MSDHHHATLVRIMAHRAAADFLDYPISDATKEVPLSQILADSSWFDEVLFGTLDNIDHPEGVDLFDRKTYATIRLEVLALLQRHLNHVVRLVAGMRGRSCPSGPAPGPGWSVESWSSDRPRHCSWP
jgi:hypothetical protein